MVTRALSTSPHVPLLCSLLILTSMVLCDGLGFGSVVRGSTGSSRGYSVVAPASVNHRDPLRTRRKESLTPLGTGPMAEGFDIFHKIAERARKVELERQRKAKEKENPNKASRGPHPDFEEVSVSLENEPDHDTGVEVESEGSGSLPRSLPKHPDFQQEVVKLEQPIEHDSPKTKKIQEHPNALPEAQTATEEEVPVDKEYKENEITEESSFEEVEKPVTKKEKRGKLLKEKRGKLLEQKVENVRNEKIKSKGKSVKESMRLPSRRLSNGNRVCETPECVMAAAQIAESLDLTADPCDDFYQFACGGWMNKHPIPKSGATGTFYEAIALLDKRLKLILETPADPGAPLPLHMLRSAYNSCMDTDTLDSLGLGPLQALLEQGQGGWPMVDDSWNPATFTLTTAINNLRTLNVFPLVAVGVDLDYSNVSYRILYVDAGTTPLGASVMSNLSNSVLEVYITFMTTAARQLRDYLGSSVTDQDIDQQVHEVIDFEREFSKIVMKAVHETTDHAWRTDVTGLQTDTDAGTPGQFNWLAFLKEMFTNTGVIIETNEPVISFKGPFFNELSTLLANTDIKTLANAIGWWWVFELQWETTYAMRSASSDFFESMGSRLPNRWQHCMDQSNGNLGFALSREYVDQFMGDTVKQETFQQVEDIRKAFLSLLENNTWMMSEDLLVAEEKLAAIDPFVAYPDWIMDDQQLNQGYEGLNIVNGDHVGNLDRIGVWFNLNSLATLREKPMHSFLYPPTIVNAFYNPQENTITILAGILQPPFYVHNSPKALYYGGIGMIIGHEMTHAFDNTGRLFDKYGNLGQWWSEEAIAAYNERAVCFVDQYNGYIPPEIAEAGLNISVNGTHTLGENIADNGGIREAYRAYQIFVDRYGEEPRLPGLDEFSPDHLFYLGFANEWCEHKNAAAIVTQIALDPHSPGRYRVLGPLSNDDQFSKVWNCPAGSNMNRGEDSCRLW